MAKDSSQLLRKLRPILLTACIVIWLTAFIATHIPAGKLPTIHTSDKTLHFYGYMVLACVLLLTLAAYGVTRFRRAMIVLIGTIAYAGVDEITQNLVGRHADMQDWLADSAGVLVAMILLEMIYYLANRLRATEPRP